MTCDVLKPASKRAPRWRVATLLLALTLAGAARGVHAWGQTGHRVIAEIAQARLSPAAKQEIEAILGRDTLSRISTWPDEIRNDPEERFKHTLAWHFIDIPDGQTVATARRSPHGDALSALERMEKTLRDRSADRSGKRYALSFLVHLVADVHQPLHVGNTRDRGGNLCFVRYLGEPTNLHALWDVGLIDTVKTSVTAYARFLRRTTSEQEARSWARGTYADWIAESQAYRAQVYPPPTRSQEGAGNLDYCAVASEHEIDDAAKPSLGYAYYRQHRALLDRRLAQAGVRLALTLDRIFAADEQHR
jgi:hypothetical protein